MFKNKGVWGLGFGHWVLDWALGIGPNPQSPIPNPQTPIPKPPYFYFIHKSKKNIFKKKLMINKIKTKEDLF